jgi:hypothetical protein
LRRPEEAWLTPRKCLEKPDFYCLFPLTPIVSHDIP